MNSKMSILFKFLQVLILNHLSNGFPFLSDDNPCSIFLNEDGTDVTLYCDEPDTRLDQIQNALNDLKGQGTIELELYQVNLGKVPSDFFKGHNIKILTIAYCNLESLTKNGGRLLEGLENTLEVLMIKGSLKDGSEFETSALSNFQKLKEVNLQYNKLNKIGNSWFKNSPSTLISVTLSNNGIEKLGDHIFSDVSNMKYLYMSDNSIRFISRNMFPSLSKLQELELDGNRLSILPDDFFTNMLNLKLVSIASNNITMIPEAVWRSVWAQLKTINLSENPLLCDAHMEWISKTSTCAKISASCKSSNEMFPSAIHKKNCD